MKKIIGYFAEKEKKNSGSIFSILYPSTYFLQLFNNNFSTAVAVFFL
jgi:hypothetical protein